MGRVNQSTLWWFDYVERIEEGKLIIMVYRAEVDGVRRRGKPKKKDEWMGFGNLWNKGVLVSGV